MGRKFLFCGIVRVSMAGPLIKVFPFKIRARFALLSTRCLPQFAEVVFSAVTRRSICRYSATRIDGFIFATLEHFTSFSFSSSSAVFPRSWRSLFQPCNCVLERFRSIGLRRSSACWASRLPATFLQLGEVRCVVICGAPFPTPSST